MLCYVSLGLWQLKLCGCVPALDALLQLRVGTWCATAERFCFAIGGRGHSFWRRALQEGKQTWRFECRGDSRVTERSSRRGLLGERSDESQQNPRGLAKVEAPQCSMQQRLKTLLLAALMDAVS